MAYNKSKSPDDKKWEFALGFHKEAGAEFSETRNLFISFVVSIVSSLGIFGYGLNSILEHPYNCNNKIYFLVATFFSLLILTFIYFISNVLSYYNKRAQILMSSAEKILDEEHDIIPESLNAFDYKNSKDPIDPISEPPELLKIFKVSTLMVEFSIFSLYIIFSIYFGINQEKITCTCLEILFLIFIVLLNFYLNGFFGWKQYHNRLNKLRDELK
ncbi:MAG: hypothetical protein ACYCSQ_05265 [bacterium]